jgi:hypothetical protein
MKYRYLIIIAIFCPLTLQAGSFAPATYEECLLDATNRGASGIAADTILDFCANLFSEEKAILETMQNSERAVVPPSVLEKLSGRAGIKRDKLGRIPPQFSGQMFNDSRWVITNITVTFFPVEEIVSPDTVRPIDKDKREALTQSCTSELTSYVWPGKGSTYEARPLTEAKFYCPEIYAPDGLNYNWYIASAQGFKT